MFKKYFLKNIFNTFLKKISWKQIANFLPAYSCAEKLAVLAKKKLKAQ